MFGVSKGKILTPKNIGLGLSVLQATRSKELVNLLVAAGRSVSYDMIRRIDTSINVCRDTDVLVLLIHFKHQLSREIWFMSGTKKDPKYVPSMK